MIQILEHHKCEHILANNYIGYLSYAINNQPYTIPITYFFDSEHNTIIAYSAEGHKIKAMRNNPYIALAVSEIESLNDWKSVLVLGTYKEIDESIAKSYLHEFSLGVKYTITKVGHKRPNYLSEFTSKINSDEASIIFTIDIKKLTGRARS